MSELDFRYGVDSFWMIGKGAAAIQNVLSGFLPTNAQKVVRVDLLRVTAFETAVTVAQALIYNQRISAQSAGTLLTPEKLSHGNTITPNASFQVRSDNSADLTAAGAALAVTLVGSRRRDAFVIPPMLGTLALGVLTPCQYTYDYATPDRPLWLVPGEGTVLQSPSGGPIPVSCNLVASIEWTELPGSRV